MSTYTMTVSGNSVSGAVPLVEGETILSALQRAGITRVHAPCGGTGKCKRCGVLLDGEQVLSCRSVPNRSCHVTLPETHSAVIETRGAADIPPCGHGLGLAVDIGTTTVAAYLYELSSGKQLAVAGGRNAQRSFGADVISRITHSAKEGGLEALSAAIRTQVSELADLLCEKTGRARAEITRVAIAGNTVMQHIFDGLSPVSIGVAPFTVQSLFGDVRAAAPLLPGMSADCEIYLCPALAGYVGGDITAGLCGSGAMNCTGASLFMDIGTNGEMGIGTQDGYICCATAAGPAFEGAEIECGMDGSEGAIDSVRYVNQDIELHVIGDVPAVGLCGSGLIDAIAAMISCGAISFSGRMTPPDEAPENIRERLRFADDGTLRFYLSEKVYVSAADVREVQLAKAAIRAGIETLLEVSGKSCADIENVFIAGGFGAYMRLESACKIGLIPAELAGLAHYVGNSAGAGAALALCPENRREIELFAEKCSYYELSGSEIFMDNYIEAMPFEEAEE